VFDVDDLQRRAGELAEFVAEKAPGRVVAVGYSNGANIAGGLLLGHPEVLAGAVLLRPSVPYVPEALPDLKGKPVWIGAGTNDPFSPPEDLRRLELMLRESGADVTVHRVEGGHGLTQEEIEAAAQWLRGWAAGPARAGGESRPATGRNSGAG
jgi:phospholipase/carboxylesterase